MFNYNEDIVIMWFSCEPYWFRDAFGVRYPTTPVTVLCSYVNR